MNVSTSELSRDVDLARQIEAGSVAAWHDFVGQYSGLIFSITRRYLADFDAETHRDAYVAILEYMYYQGLARYDGRSALSTWLMTIARSRALDIRRGLRGRKRDPAWLDRLPSRDREIYHLYFEKGEDLETIHKRFERRGEAMSLAQLTRSLDRLEARMDHRLRARVAYDLYARSLGSVSGSLLSYLDHLRVEQAAVAEALRPDMQIMEVQARVLLDRVRREVHNLGPEERKVVELHFYRGLTAPEVATAMGLQGARRAYTLIDRAVGMLREAVCRPPAGAWRATERPDSNGGNR